MLAFIYLFKELNNFKAKNNQDIKCIQIAGVTSNNFFLFSLIIGFFIQYWKVFIFFICVVYGCNFPLFLFTDQRNLGMSMRVERSSLDQVKKRFEVNKKKMEEKQKEYDFEERMKELREEVSVLKIFFVLYNYWLFYV